MPQDTLNVVTDLPNPFADLFSTPEPEPPRVSSLTLGEESRPKAVPGCLVGHVLDFTTNLSFREFFAEEFEIPIYGNHDGDKYGFKGNSKANRLRALWHVEPDPLVAKVLATLIARAEQLEDSPDPDLVEQCREIGARLRGAEAPLDDLVSLARVENLSQLQAQIARMRDKAREDPDLAIGTAKEIVETVCKTILGDCGVSLPSDPKMPALLKATLKELKLVPDSILGSRHGTGSIKRILGGLGSIGHGLAELRNLYGTGHGRHGASSGLQPRHARLAVGAMATLAVFLFETHEARRLELGSAPFSAS